MMMIKVLCWWNKILLFFLCRLSASGDSFTYHSYSQLPTYPASHPLLTRLFPRKCATATADSGTSLQLLSRDPPSQVQDGSHPTTTQTQHHTICTISSLLFPAPIPWTATKIVHTTTVDIHFRLRRCQVLLAYTAGHTPSTSSGISIKRNQCVSLLSMTRVISSTTLTTTCQWTNLLISLPTVTREATIFGP